MLVWISSPTFLIEILLMFVSPCFPRDAVISFSEAKTNSLLLTTLLTVINLLCGCVQHLPMWKVFIVRMLSYLPLAVYLNKQVSISYFFMFLGAVLVAIIFSIWKGKNLARQTFSKDSMTMNLGKSTASFSESDLDKIFFFFFLLEDTISDVSSST